ncbi:beta-glucosidase [Neorhizobium galegae]|uniref:beta-glucosidase H n=1 Tax=Neorhizobium galegae TaxID=399 RepID=UPI001AE90142|nr:glycoside hydrolase family 3 C-terminal domain-containing protein [Neorhizobium galegae]MBP2563203.1 beta-glucosidase [Neorhizobium galegae]
MNDRRIDDLLDAMTLEEQVSLLSGASFWRTNAIERLAIPSIKVTDGPNGARGENFSGGITSAAFPAAISLAASWDVDMVRAVGMALAQEAKSKGAQVLLAPTVNMHRNVLNGRNFECFSEDPHLASEMAVAYINGVQSEGIAATVKHFIGNETEVERRTISSEINERTLREVYLPPFEAAVKRAGVWCVMTAYNYLNGVHCAENPWLLNSVLREEWGFDGVVMSDWTATHSTVEALVAGLDLEMPGPTVHRGAKLVEATRHGKVDPAAIRQAAGRVLRLIERTGCFETPQPAGERADNRPEHRALIRCAGAKGAVLLKNENILPLKPETLKRVAVIGPHAATPAMFGGGSARINAHYQVSPLEAMRAALGPDVVIEHALGCSVDRYYPLLTTSVAVDFFNGSTRQGAPILSKTTDTSEFRWFGPVEDGVDQNCFSARFSTTYVAQEAGIHGFGLMSAGTSRLYLDGELLLDAWSGWKRGESYFGHGSDEIHADVHLTKGQSYRLMIEYACGDGLTTTLKAVRFGIRAPSAAGSISEAVQLAAQSDAVILVVGLNEDWETEAEDRRGIELPGSQNALIEAVLKANPRAIVTLQSGSPLAMPWLERALAVLQLWYPGQECGNALADVLLGNSEPGGRLPITYPLSLGGLENVTKRHEKHGKVAYDEGLFIGYRHFDRHPNNVLFPFGHGLSYGNFEYRDLTIDQWHPDAGLSVFVTIANTGDKAGDEVIQLYVQPVGPAIDLPPKSLASFERQLLSPGEEKIISLTVDKSRFKNWSSEHNGFTHLTKTFDILVGRSAGDIRLARRLNID